MSGDNKNDVVARVGNAVLYRNELQKRIAWEGLGNLNSLSISRVILRELSPEVLNSILPTCPTLNPLIKILLFF